MPGKKEWKLLWSALAVSCWIATAGFGQAVYQPDLDSVPTPNVDAEMEAFQVAEGFEINLFASNPDIAKPIQINFDRQGRLWVAGSETYPHIVPGDIANDKIVILEDTDSDGVADCSTVFADRLLIPTGVAPGDGGVYVANSTELLFLSDTDGDGKADSRRVVLSGFGTEDTHHILHTLQWGMDGSLYMNQSIYIHSHVETPYGVRRLNGGGTWKFRPETIELEVFMKGLVNHWGHIFNDWGASFMTDGAGGEGINYVFPGATFMTSPGARNILHGLNPGSPKHCSLEIVTGDGFPEDWQGSLIANDFRARRVCRFVLSEDGSGYSSKEMPEVVKTSHVSFRPVDVAMGPDGALYIADFYNPIIQHGEVDFRDPRRDHENGRIWRVTRKGGKPIVQPEIVGASVEDLLGLLKSDSQYTRLRAKLELRERDPEKVHPLLEEWIAHLDPSDESFEHLRLEGLWTLQNIRKTNPNLLKEMLNSKDHRVRAAAVRVVPQWREALGQPVDLLAERVQDDHPQVRLEAVRALAKFPSVESSELALNALDHEMDRFLDHALWLTVDELTPLWFPKVRSGESLFGGDPKKLLYALEVIDQPSIVEPLLALLSREDVDKESHGQALQLVAKFGNADHMRSILDRVFDSETAESEKANLLSALLEATKNRGLIPSGDLAGLTALFDSESPDLQRLAIRASGTWKVEATRDFLTRTAKRSGDLQNVAIEALSQLGGDKSRETLTGIVDSQAEVPTRIQAVIGLANIDLAAAADKAAELLSKLGEGADPTVLFNAFLQRQQGPAKLAESLADKQLPADTAKLGVRIIGGTGRSEPELIAALSKAGGLSMGRTEISAGEMTEILAAVESGGDPARGEALYRTENMNCITCHAIAGSGGKVGPDLSTIGASAQDDYLVEALLLPNAKVKEGYHSKTIYTDDGEVFTGVPIRETETETVIRDQFDEEISIPAAAIESVEEGMSLMPGGLTDLLTTAELADMVAFLSALGEEGPYGISTQPIVRSWEVLMDTPTAKENLRVTGIEPVVHNHEFSWSKVYSKVSGAIPLSGLPEFRIYGSYSGSGSTVFLRFQIESSKAGKVGLQFDGAMPSAGFIGIEEIEIGEETVIEIEEGVQTVTLAIPFDSGNDTIRCELVEVDRSEANAKPVL